MLSLTASRPPVQSPVLTAAEIDFRVAVVLALCGGRSALSVRWEFRPAARSLGVRSLVWLDDEIERLTLVSVRGSR